MTIKIRHRSTRLPVSPNTLRPTDCGLLDTAVACRAMAGQIRIRSPHRGLEIPEPPGLRSHTAAHPRLHHLQQR